MTVSEAADDTAAACVRVGCAGWGIPKEHAARFPDGSSHLERYARRFPAVEINSSFYRPHRPATYARWASSVPRSFRFSVKVPREITHTRRLKDPVESLDRFLSEVSALGAALGPLLVQLPPSLAFESEVASAFFSLLRERFAGAVACEPRHPSWFTQEAGRVLIDSRIARVAADPAPMPSAAHPGGWPGLIYYRLHGSPHMYHSAYPEGYRAALAPDLLAASENTPVWCIFDNTALGAATADALDLLGKVVSRSISVGTRAETGVLFEAQ